MAGEVTAMACELGFATRRELRDRIMSNSSHIVAERLLDVDELIQKLIDDHFLVMLRRAHFNEPHDAKREIELTIISPAALARLTGTKARLEHEEAIEGRYRRAIDTGHPEYGYVNASFLSSMSSDSSDMVNGAAVNGRTIQPSPILTPNYHKVVVISQVVCASDSVRKLHGKKGASVVSCAIQQVADQDFWSRHGDGHLHQLDLYKLQQDVRSDLKRGQSGDLMDGTVNIDGRRPGDREVESDVGVGEIEGELKLLHEGPLKFVSHPGPVWVLDRDELDLWTRQQEILRIMDSRLEPPAPRILRILIDKGKLEEKTLQEMGLLGAKELRQSLSKLKQIGYLDLQEIPREPHRIPSKTVFLWNHDPDRVAKLVLENVYAAILHLIQMLKLERAPLAGISEKIEREHLQGKEQESLSAREFSILARFKRLQQWIWGEIHRLDFTVAILRDA